MKKSLFFIAGCLLIIISSCTRFGRKLDYTFVVAGDVRVKPQDTVGDPSTANVYELKRLFTEVSKLKPMPKYLFFNGDLVVGHTSDTVRLARELENWVKIYKESPLAKTSLKLVALPGNHEVCEKLGGAGISLAANERVFVRIMKDYIRGDNGPHATGLIPGTDSLMSDQSHLTYSFDYGGDHFVIINTDPVDRESRPPYHWLEKDLASAHKDGARHIFIFEHKPAYPCASDSEEALGKYKSNRDSLWRCLEKYNCDAMFCSHDHLWDTVEPDRGKTWEIIVGNAGAPMHKQWLPSYNGFTVVNVYSKVGITNIGHYCNKKTYTEPCPQNISSVKAKFTIK